MDRDGRARHLSDDRIREGYGGLSRTSGQAESRFESLNPRAELAHVHQPTDYKAASAGGQLVRVDPKYTTQRCSNCGGLPITKLTRKDRWYHCTHCGYRDDRDVNALKNVLLKGLALFDAGGTLPAVSATEKRNQDISLDRHGTV